MSSYEMQGTVKEIMEQVTFGSGFTKREFVVTDESGKYPQDIKFELTKDNVSKLDSISVGSEVAIHFDLCGNNKNSAKRYFVNLRAWRLDLVAGAGEYDEPKIAAPEGEAGAAAPAGAGGHMPF